MFSYSSEACSVSNWDVLGMSITAPCSASVERIKLISCGAVRSLLLVTDSCTQTAVFWMNSMR